MEMAHRMDVPELDAITGEPQVKDRSQKDNDAAFGN
jgi:hypothetical protein